MRNGLFRRYVATFGFMLIICTFLLGLAQLYFSIRNFAADRQQLLSATAERIESLLETRISESTGAFVLPEKNEILEDLHAIYQSTGVTSFITDPNGRVLICSEGENCTHINDIDEHILAITLRQEQTSKTGYFNGFFRFQGEYIYGRPLMQENAVGGFLFLSLPVRPLFSHLGSNMATFALSAGFMLIVAMIIIYFATRRLTRPLHEISNAAIRFGSGDFSARVPVTGDDEIARLARSFNGMADSLTEFETMRRSFVADVSHELRTPMTTIGGYIDGILDNTIPPDKNTHYLAIVSSEVKRLSRLTSSLLDITRIEEGAIPVKMQAVNVWEVVLSVMSGAERRILEKQLLIPDLDMQPTYALCDRDMLYQIIYNLLDNAIKFSQVGATVEVSVTLQDNFVNIVIRNSGEGISERELHHIFERFYKIDKSRGLDRSGTGLGLFISKTLAQRMDGDLMANSVPGQYTEFIVTLKATAPPERSKDQNRDTKKARGKKHPED